MRTLRYGNDSLPYRDAFSAVNVLEFTNKGVTLNESTLDRVIYNETVFNLPEAEKN